MHYKPQAYPQISQALMEMYRAIAGTDIDKPLGRGYALVTDLPWWAPLAGSLIFAVATGITTAWDTYQQTRNVGRTVACGLWMSVNAFIGGTVSAVGGFGGFIYGGVRMLLAERFAKWIMRC